MDDSKSHWPENTTDDAAPTASAADAAGMRLAVIRREIDAVDQDLLAIFNRRAALSLEVGRIKAGVTDAIFKPMREKEVLDSLAAGNPGPLPNDHLRAIWREIFSSSRALQRPHVIRQGLARAVTGHAYTNASGLMHPHCQHATYQRVFLSRAELSALPCPLKLLSAHIQVLACLGVVQCPGLFFGEHSHPLGE